jgi:hypothetical protein
MLLLAGCTAPIGWTPAVTVLKIQDERPEACLYFFPPIGLKKCFDQRSDPEEQVRDR